MAWQSFLSDTWHAVWHWVEPLVPGALGAAVGQAWEKGLGLKDRMIQWAVGLLFAAYVVPAVCTHVLNWSQPLTNAAGFVVGTIAFKAVGRWREAAVEGGASAFAHIPEWLGTWFRRPGSPPPAAGEGE